MILFILYTAHTMIARYDMMPFFFHLNLIFTISLLMTPKTSTHVVTQNCKETSQATGQTEA